MATKKTARPFSTSFSCIRCLAALWDRNTSQNSCMYLYYPLECSDDIPSVLIEAFQSLKVESAIRALSAPEKRIITIDFSSRSFLEYDPIDPIVWREIVHLLLQTLASDNIVRQRTRGSKTLPFQKALVQMEKIDKKFDPEVELSLYEQVQTAVAVADILSELLETLDNLGIVVIWKLATKNNFLIDMLQYILLNLRNSATVFFPVLLFTNQKNTTRTLRHINNHSQSTAIPIDFDEHDGLRLVHHVLNDITDGDFLELVSPPTIVQFFGDMLFYCYSTTSISEIKVELRSFLLDDYLVHQKQNETVWIHPDSIRQFFEKNTLHVRFGISMPAGFSLEDVGLQIVRSSKSHLPQISGPPHYLALLSVLGELGADNLHVIHAELYQRTEERLSHLSPEITREKLATDVYKAILWARELGLILVSQFYAAGGLSYCIRIPSSTIQSLF
ncbi:MAG: hypothetical protein ACFFCQ_13815 [Promethearchaeota archaeon]